MRNIKFRLYYQHGETGRIQTQYLCIGHSWPKISPRYYIIAQCQFTGLQDKNGVDIYEGDILQYSGHVCKECEQHVEYPNHTLYMIQWDDLGLCYTCESDDNYMSPDVWKTDMEVIGNIYENQELLP